MSMTTKQLEQLAIDAHEAGDDWATFWRQYGQHVTALEPDDYFARGQLVHRLVGLVASGDTDGHRAVGDGEPWQIDDDPPMVPIIDDTTTAARCLWQPRSRRLNTTPPAVASRPADDNDPAWNAKPVASGPDAIPF